MPSRSIAACHSHYEACCNIPPIIASGYIPRGIYEDVGGLKTYRYTLTRDLLRKSDLTLEADTMGRADATKGIISIYNIFGYFAQTLQGADILAYGDENNKYKVFIPDWFKGNACPMEW